MCVPPPPSQAVAITYRAGILRDEHFLPDNTDGGSEHMRGAAQLKPNRAMEGRVFRKLVTHTLHITHYTVQLKAEIALHHIAHDITSH